MAVLKTSWGTAPKKEVKVPEKKKEVITSTKAKKVIEQKPIIITEDTTAEEIIATLPKKQRGVKKVNIENQE